MPCVLLTLASEEVRGEAFLPQWQVPGNHFRAVFSAAKKSLITKCAGKVQWVNPFNGKVSCVTCHVQFFLYFLASYGTKCTDRLVKGEIAGRSQAVTCSCRCYVICMGYTSFASQQEKFRARTLRATTAAPPHAVLRESLLCVNLAAEMGVCSDVNAIHLSGAAAFNLQLIHIVTRCTRCRRVL